MKILLIFGTRPEAIKMCPLVKELKTHPSAQVSVCLTGQHRELADEVLQIFGVEPEFDLSVMEPKQSPETVAAKLLSMLPAVLSEVQPHLVLVHGDTASAFAASLACFYRGIPVGHVEAGLRTGRLDAPFPEEFHRRAIDMSAALCFAPTENARQRLLAEGKDPETVFVTGNTGIDALKTTVRGDFTHRLLEEDGEYLFLTAHRRENHGAPLAEIFSAAKKILDLNQDLRVICPLHPNPAVRRVAEEILGSHPRARLIEPLSVIECHNLLARARLILTDSGGIQEEATALARPVLVLREVTERPEGVEEGYLIPTGTKEENIIAAAQQILSGEAPSAEAKLCNTVYGNGDACKTIADLILRWLEKE
jgi:UDP-N-acetylglucosamine 2-epimerase (non-hydrolysing)